MKPVLKGLLAKRRRNVMWRLVREIDKECGEEGVVAKISTLIGLSKSQIRKVRRCEENLSEAKLGKLIASTNNTGLAKDLAILSFKGQQDFLSRWLKPKALKPAEKNKDKVVQERTALMSLILSDRGITCNLEQICPKIAEITGRSLSHIQKVRRGTENLSDQLIAKLQAAASSDSVRAEIPALAKTKTKPVPNTLTEQELGHPEVAVIVLEQKTIVTAPLAELYNVEKKGREVTIHLVLK